MRGAAITFAEQLDNYEGEVDLLLCSDFLSLADLVGLRPARLSAVPKVAYFHENQLTYPLQCESERDYQYAFTNITTCLAADWVYFNSSFHRDSFLEALGPFLRKMPDCVPRDVVARVREKSSVLYLGCDFEPFRAARRLTRREGPPLIVWNHRWEYDKNPEEFFAALFQLQEADRPFRVAIVGERFRYRPPIFDEARARLGDRIEQFGFVPDRAAYAQLLCRADIAVSTSIHEFFGLSAVEAMYSGCYPVFPHRLTYPELIAPRFHERHLYRSPAGLVKMLRNAIETIDQVRQIDLSAEAERFSWSNLISQYDRELALVVERAGERR